MRIEPTPYRPLLRRLNRFRLPLWCALIPLLITACSTTGCLENQSALPKAVFASSSDNKTIAIDSLQVWGVGSPGDSLLVYSRVSSTYLPLRSSASSSSFCFHYTAKELNSPRLNDTITLAYTSSPRFISEECGAMYYYTITSLRTTTHLIDSVVLTDSLVTNFDKETIRIYFRTAEPDSGDDSSNSSDTE